MAEIDLTILEDRPISGGVLDITNAFDYLPRLPIFLACINFWVPGSFVHAWARAVGDMSRAFLLFGHLSAPFPTTHGFPQGDPLSIVAMLVTSVIWVHSITTAVPAVECFAYADNWEWQTWQLADAVATLHASHSFCDSVHLVLQSAPTSSRLGSTPLHQTKGGSSDKTRF